MFIKIYFDDKPVYLCDAIEDEWKDVLQHPDAIFIDEISTPAINALLHEIKKEQFHAGVLLHNDLNKLKKQFFKHFTHIEAAGGIVQNPEHEILFIYRLKKWDLPKGKVEEGEDAEACAVREVEEETGVTHLTVKQKTGETYHTYNAYGKHFIKTTHWFYMTCPSDQRLVPQTEEDIDQLKWVSTKALEEPLADTYPSIKDILASFFDTP